jgi:SAM-dependent methyltransferase
VLYDYPEYYEIAFSFRDIPQEVAFLHACIEGFSRYPTKRVLEIACGTAPHAGELAARGYHYIGLDINRNMLDHAAYKWRHLSPRPRFLQANMVSFDCDQKVDFAYVLLGSLYLNNVEEMTSHFDSVAQVLNPGGLYFLDWCIQFSNPLLHNDNNAYTIEQDGVEIESKFDIKLLDPACQMYEEVWTVNVNDHGRHQAFEMIERNKAILPGEFMKFLKSRPDFEFVGWWKDWNLQQPIVTKADVNRQVVLIRRTD